MWKNKKIKKINRLMSNLMFRDSFFKIQIWTKSKRQYTKMRLNNFAKITGMFQQKEKDKFIKY